MWRAQAPYSSVSRLVWLHDLADFTKACDMINATDWSSVLSGDINRAAEQWTQVFLNIMQECIPYHMVRKKSGKKGSLLC